MFIFGLIFWRPEMARGQQSCNSFVIYLQMQCCHLLFLLGWSQQHQATKVPNIKLRFHFPLNFQMFCPILGETTSVLKKTCQSLTIFLHNTMVFLCFPVSKHRKQNTGATGAWRPKARGWPCDPQASVAPAKLQAQTSDAKGGQVEHSQLNDVKW